MCKQCHVEMKLSGGMIICYPAKYEYICNVCKGTFVSHDIFPKDLKIRKEA